MMFQSYYYFCPVGEMVDTEDLKSSGESRASSSLAPGTSFKIFI